MICHNQETCVRKAFLQKSLRATRWPQGKCRQPILSGDGGAVSGRHSKRCAGDLHGGHRCRELWSAYCLSLFPCSLLQHLRLRTTAGSIAAPSRMAPANGAVVTTTARAIRAYPPQRAGWMIDGELVPFDEAMPVAPPDGQLTICRRPDGTRRCVFGLKPGL